MSSSSLETDAIMEKEGFVWNDGFKLGYDPMDQTHEEFVDIVGSILVCPENQLLQYLEEFAAHAEKHFADELRWMEATDYPNTECHAEQHDAVMQSVNDVLCYVKSGGDLEEVRKLARALVDWFPGHADYLDSALAQWLVKRKSGGVPIVLRRNLKFDGA